MIRKPFDRERTPTITETIDEDGNREGSRTKPSYEEECNINVIVKRYGQTGMWNHLEKRQPTFGDFTQATDLLAATQLVENARADFMTLPASVRKACNHDPVELLQGLADPERFKELVAAGLPVVTPTETLAVPANPTPPPAGAPVPGA